MAFQASARMALHGQKGIRDPDVATANAVFSVIAFTDALTAACLGVVNQQDHAAAVKLLRAALGKELPFSQERQLQRLIGRKDESSYGARVGRMEDAEHLLGELEQFATWAIQVLATRGVRVAQEDAETEACSKNSP